MMNGKGNRRLRAGALAIGAAACLAYAPTAEALIVEGMQSMPRPDNGWIGNFNGATGICVGPQWVMSAKHVGGQVGSWFILRGDAYQVIEERPHPQLDLVLYKMDRALPGFHKIAVTAALGDPVIMGGFGFTAAAALPNNTGYDWNGARQETWGANVIEMEGNLWGVRFDPPSSAESVAYESLYALSDSGGGLFVVAGDGSLQVAGMAVSVSGYGQARYGSMGFCINVINFRNWIMPIVDPDTPIDSAIQAPTAMREIGVDGEKEIALAGVGVMVMMRRRRRV
jgi:hypothetical protein